MDASVEEILKEHLRRFAGQFRHAGEMVGLLQADGIEITHAREVAPSTWFLRAKPPQHLQEGFGLAPEILLIVITQGGVQARDIQRANSEVMLSGLRLDSNLVIVTDTHFDLQDRLDRIPGTGQRVAWVWDDKDHWAPLSEVLRQQLPTYDAFEERDPVRGDQLMGRDAEVATLRTRVVRGDAVGVFGLRKMGKTSLVRAVTDSLDPASALRNEAGGNDVTSRTCVVWVDAEMLDPDAQVDDVAREMLVSLRRRMRAAQMPYAAPERQGFAGLKDAGEALLDENWRLCFVIDEYDFLFEREADAGPVPGLSRLLRLLRAWSQTRQGTVSLILIGRDPEHLSVPLLDGVSNPLLAWFIPMWLGPLAAPRDTAMLRRLGRRTGLDIGPESAERARHWTGGHPLLHRQFGSALRQATLNHHPALAWKAKTDAHCNEAVERFLERDTVHTVAREVLALLDKRYRPAHDLLLTLAEQEGPPGTLKNQKLHTDGSQTLRNFGILDERTQSLPAYLSWYVRKLLPPMRRMAV
ncbi:ATP-binding protein [Chondromyces apiculatus]|uniref:Uncharacterized protein n=1 Tax=Chondromyces apiculatus DSM 436 TaxID=1192034 RepID=A0A017TIP2_9BACT|nr:ATP-binding protein [Chondromyces apiculatus]EYF08772.1 Hypothetical protein CAP_2633 [Chondromyces apiculatus DSM 436]